MSAIVVGASLYAFAVLTKAAVGYDTKVRYDEPTRHVVIEQSQPVPEEMVRKSESEKSMEETSKQYPKPIDTYPYYK